MLSFPKSVKCKYIQAVNALRLVLHFRKNKFFGFSEKIKSNEILKRPLCILHNYKLNFLNVVQMKNKTRYRHKSKNLDITKKRNQTFHFMAF